MSNNTRPRGPGTRSSAVGLRDCSRQSLHRYWSLSSNGAVESRHSTSFARCAAQQHGLLSAATVFCSSTAPSPTDARVPRMESDAVAIPSPRAPRRPEPPLVQSGLHRRGAAGATGGAGVLEPGAGAAARDTRSCADAERRGGPAVHAYGAATTLGSAAPAATPGDPTEQKSPTSSHS